MREFRLVLALCIIGMIPVICLVVIVFYVARASHQKEAKELVGLYTIDLNELGTHDIYIDRRMSVELRSDNTFKLTHTMPNIYDTKGTWAPGDGGVDTPNKVCYGLDKPRCCNITRCFSEGTDTIMYMSVLFKDAKFHTPLNLKFRKVKFSNNKDKK